MHIFIRHGAYIAGMKRPNHTCPKIHKNLHVTIARTPRIAKTQRFSASMLHELLFEVIRGKLHSWFGPGIICFDKWFYSNASRKQIGQGCVDAREIYSHLCTWRGRSTFGKSQDSHCNVQIKIWSANKRKSVNFLKLFYLLQEAKSKQTEEAVDTKTGKASGATGDSENWQPPKVRAKRYIIKDISPPI